MTQFGFNSIKTGDEFDSAYAVRKDIIAQKFIPNPYLINNRKFHIRIFVMVVSLNPYIILYGNGFIILAANQYNEYELDKNNAITNRAISKNIDNDNANNWSLSFDQFKKYLNQDENFNIEFDQIQTQIKEILHITFSSAIKQKKDSSKVFDKSFLKTHSHSYQYALFAVDLLMTDDGKLKLLEVQNSPKTSVIPKNCNKERHWACQYGKGLIKETVDIAIEIAYRKTQKLEITQSMIQDIINQYQLILFNDFKDDEMYQIYDSSEVEYYHRLNIGEF